MKHFFSLATLALTLSLLGPQGTSARLFKNIHTVDKGKLYRSAQLSYNQFARTIEKYNIKTIINLRGESPKKDWYRDEIQVSKKYGVQHFDIGMSARRIPHAKDLRKLLELFETAPKPILIHCAGGADRTGEASALYRMIYFKESSKKAIKKELKLTRGHIESRFPAKKYFVKHVWKGRKWAMNRYNPCGKGMRYKHYDKKRYCRSGVFHPRKPRRR